MGDLAVSPSYLRNIVSRVAVEAQTCIVYSVYFRVWLTIQVSGVRVWPRGENTIFVGEKIRIK